MKKTVTASMILFLLLSTSASAYNSMMLESNLTQGDENQNATIDAHFSATPISGNAPLTVQFNDLSTGNPRSWLWNFGDGDTSAHQNPSHMYTKAGTYTITLTATNIAGGDKATKSNYIVVTASNLPSPSDAPSPVAAFTASTTRGTAPATIKFTDQSTGAPTSWAWNFGDGNTSALQSPYHMYTQTGTYTVTLTATNDAGSNKTTKSNYIVVTASNLPVAPPPLATFTASPISGNAPLTVKFTETSTWLPSSWSWNFGDSKVSTEQDPTHTFAKAGNFTILLTARKGNISSTTSAQIVVSPTVVAALKTSASTGTESVNIKKNYSNNNSLKPTFNVSKTVPTNLRVLWRGKTPHRVSFLDKSRGHTSWYWVFGDGKTSRYKNIYHMYKTPGKYLVKLTVTTPDHRNKTTYCGYIVIEATLHQPQ